MPYSSNSDVGLCDPADLPVVAGRTGRRDARQVHVHAEAGRGDRVQIPFTCRLPVVARAGEAGRDDRCTREAAPGGVHVTVDCVNLAVVLQPAAVRSRARQNDSARNQHNQSRSGCSACRTRLLLQFRGRCLRRRSLTTDTASTRVEGPLSPKSSSSCHPVVAMVA